MTNEIILSLTPQRKRKTLAILGGITKLLQLEKSLKMVPRE
jgi:hypothetical protein